VAAHAQAQGSANSSRTAAVSSDEPSSTTTVFDRRTVLRPESLSGE
jgi:hypothetical protein